MQPMQSALTVMQIAGLTQERAWEEACGEGVARDRRWAGQCTRVSSGQEGFSPHGIPCLSSASSSTRETSHQPHPPHLSHTHTCQLVSTKVACKADMQRLVKVPNEVNQLQRRGVGHEGVQATGKSEGALAVHATGKSEGALAAPDMGGRPVRA